MSNRLDEIEKEIRNLLLKKGNDYSTEKDRLINFKVIAEMTVTTAEIACMSLMATKIARLINLISSGKEPSNESVSDSAVDLVVYSVLDWLIINEKEFSNN